MFQQPEKLSPTCCLKKYWIQEPEQPKKIVVTKSWNAGNQALVIQIITKEKSKGATTFVITH